jgi:uncharacterized protein YhfF
MHTEVGQFYGLIAMKTLKPLEERYWRKYLSTVAPEKIPEAPRVEARYAGNKLITDGLLDLYLIGKKTAGSSIAEDFQSAGDPLPKVGSYWILLKSNDEPGCILKTDRIEFHKFKDVPPAIAIAEGEGDLSLEYWRRVHEELYRPHLSGWGLSEINEATVLTEFFTLVYR